MNGRRKMRLLHDQRRRDGSSHAYAPVRGPAQNMSRGPSLEVAESATATRRVQQPREALVRHW